MCVFGGNLNALTASLCMFKQKAIREWSMVALIAPSLMDLATMLYASAIGCAEFSLSFWATSVREILE
ncbi:hypothetical protein F2Q68_00021694 [Brassica cretica]|uniref:Uncharacterized protein n=1 Tax=Brassica cretica TaxID=69181 RepID=A0A8S9FXC9_BRACR|nr:hypothetical protein F2Q68_00021694 [Brassica cretica]